MSSGQNNTNDRDGSSRQVNALQIIPSPAIAEVPQNDHPNLQPSIPQPRQPRDLQGLLRFAMEATVSEDPTNPSHFQAMAPERKAFLENALKGMTVNVAEELTKAIQELKRVGNISTNDDPSEFEAALETILSFVDQIDAANDFHKIGGFEVLKPCLQSDHTSIQSQAAYLVGELTQNNPYCQTHILAAGLLPLLLQLVDEGKSEQVRVKALFAVSCLVRDCPAALEELIQLDGCSVLLRAIQSDTERLRVKAAFLVGALCRQHNAVRDQLYATGWVQQLAGLLRQERNASTEHILSALFSLIRDHQGALEECRNPQLEIRSLLSNYIETHLGREECQEEIECAQQILQLVYPDDNTTVSTIEDR